MIGKHRPTEPTSVDGYLKCSAVMAKLNQILKLFAR